MHGSNCFGGTSRCPCARTCKCRSSAAGGTPMFHTCRTAATRFTPEAFSLLEPLEFRVLMSSSAVPSLDGTGNNVLHPDWGAARTELLRLVASQYADGISAPA